MHGRALQREAQPKTGMVQTHVTAQPPGFARWCTPKRSGTSRNRARLAAKKRPSNRSAAIFYNHSLDLDPCWTNLDGVVTMKW